jgi:predicted GTPase
MIATKKNDISPNVIHESDIVELMGISEFFAPLKNMSIPEDDAICWDMNGKDAYCIQAMFIGKTGYGKSTSLNKICGRELFQTDDISSCTKEIFSSEYKIHNKKNYFLSFCDLPGLGESIEADKQYIQWYAKMLLKSYCLVYVLRADQRDYAVDEEKIKTLLADPLQRKKIIIAINFADMVEPHNKTSSPNPSKEQLHNLNEKKIAIKKLFKVPEKNIVCYSAKTGYNIEILKQKIANTLILMIEENKKPKKSEIPFDEEEDDDD